MKQEFAEIIVHRNQLPFGGFSTRFEWRGSRGLPVEIHVQCLRNLGLWAGLRFPVAVNLGGIPLRLIPESERFLTQSAFYVRTDGAGWMRWLWYVAHRAVQHSLLDVYERSILTLYVWGLAKHDPAVRPSWRDIKLFRK